MDLVCQNSLVFFFFILEVFFLQITLLEIQALECGQGEPILHIPPVPLSQDLGWLWGGKGDQKMKWELLLALFV